jgi:hypothetical protein
MNKILLIFCIISMNLFALDVDEKLTIRILRTSSSKKTILINRGQEDGLVKGDHAKFYLAEGVLARGELMKLSPQRSVWAIYRLIDSDEIKEEAVLNLKVTPKYKITSDPSKSIIKDDVPATITSDPESLGIPLADGARDLTPEEKALLQKTEDMMLASVSLREKLHEVGLGLSWGQMSGTSTGSIQGNDENTTAQQVNFQIFYERYFENEVSWYGRSSIGAEIITRQLSQSTFEGSRIDETQQILDFSVSIYPGSLPNSTEQFIGFAFFHTGIGTVTSGVTPRGSSSTEQSSGGLVTYGLGGGVKYFTRHGYGLKIKGDYSIVGEEFGADSNNVDWVRSQTGLNFNLAISKRF